MIVRIATEGQYELPAADEDALNQLDEQAVAACEEGDEPRFRAAFDELLRFIRDHGAPVADDHLGASDLILPPPDATLEEARGEFESEGLIPE